MFSESSPGCWAVLQLHCCPSKQGELKENLLQNLWNKWPPHMVYLEWKSQENQHLIIEPDGKKIYSTAFFINSIVLPGTLSSLFLPSSPLSFFSVTRALSKHVYLIILHMHSLACRSFARALKQWSGSVVMNTNRLRSVFL